MTTGERYLQIKCSVNTRAPLTERLLPIQGTSRRALPDSSAASRSAFLQHRHPVESTYSASLRSIVRGAEDVPPRGKEIRQSVDDVVASVPFRAVSTQRAEYCAGHKSPDEASLSFYSRVRQLEQKDADALLSATTKKVGTQRSSEVLVKRATAPEFRPPEDDYSILNASVQRRAASRGEPSTSADAAEEKVKNFTHVPPSTYQTEYHRPNDIVPLDISQAFQTQRSALSDYSPARDLFRGTAKSLPALVLPAFMGHVPASERNVQRMHGIDGTEVWRPHCKCTINLASSKGASTLSSLRSDRSDASIATTVMGFYTLQAAQASAAEKAINGTRRPIGGR